MTTTAPTTQTKPPAKAEDEPTFPELVRQELRMARGLHGNHASLHESYAVLIEEVEEFWEHVRQGCEDREANEILLELIQVGAMAQRAAEDAGLIPPVN